MTPEVTNAVAAIAAAGTAVLNFAVIFFRAKHDPTALQTAANQFKEIRKMNKRTAKNTDRLHTLLDTRLHNVELILNRLDKSKGVSK